MSPDIARRLVASLKYDVINGSQDERAIFASQVREAINCINSHAAQIATMKEKLVEERAQVLAGKGNLIWEPLPDDDRPDGLYPALVIRGKAYWRTVAHQQIEAEMVWVEWEC